MSDENDTKEKVTRRDFVVLSATSMAAVGAACALWPMVDSMNPASNVVALSSIEVDLSSVKEGQTLTVKWRGKPVFIRNRTQAEITEAKTTPQVQLIDPQLDDDRVKKGYEKWLVVVGTCTHLGCVPLSNQGDYGGWLCPCHGSQYDVSGRVRKGPAPLNLTVPPYEFLSDTKIKIG
jgi:ubiquinol-cytochrome c reductase iron-sulfur subunit